MKPTFIALLAVLLCVGGCGKEKVEQAAKETPKTKEAPKKSNPKPPPVKPGTVLLEFETGDSVYSSPAIGTDGTVYVGSSDKKLYAVNPKSGAKLWEFETRDYVASSPAIGSDGTVYVGSDDNKLYALNPKSGAKLWEFETGGFVDSSPAIGSDGTVYVRSWDNKLYAIKTESKGPAKSPWPMRGQNAQHTGRVMKK
jgi:outer membrane protein assembly factor BamB